jgi:hypothetical protein
VTTTAEAQPAAAPTLARPFSVRATLAAWPFQDVVLPFAVTRVLLVLAGFFALYTMPAAPNGDPWQASPHALVNAWASWDSRWYLQIAQQGYTLTPDADGQLPVAFWPTLPLLIRLGGLALHRTDSESLALIGIAIANLALIAAVFYLVRLGREVVGNDSARRAGLYLLIFPSTLFLSAVYPHSLFLACAIASLFYARHAAWWVAGLLGAVATLTRPVGVLLIAPLVWECVSQAGPATLSLRQRLRHRLARPLPLLALAPVPLALLGWMAYLGVHFGTPLAFLDAQRAWNRAPTAPWHILDPYLQGYSSVYGYSSTYLDLGFGLLYVVLVVLAWRLLPRSLALFATLLLLVPISTGSTQSLMRFGLELFPIFLVLGVLGRRHWFHQSFAILSLGFATVFTVMFALHYWVA